MTDAPIFLSVVSPVYRAEKILPALCERLTKVLSALNHPYEIVLVDDRSPDRSWAVMRQLSETYPQIVSVRLSRNFGQHYAITAGLDMVRGEWTVIMDCDLQDAPEEIPRLLAVAEKGFDVVLARRAVRKDKLHKRILARLFYSIFNFLSGYRMDPSVGSFRILHRRVVDAYKSMHEAARLFGGMIEWLGFETTCVDVEHGERYEGSSTYDLRAMMRLALDGMIAFSNRPLYLSVGAGALMAIASAAVGLCWLIMYFTLPVFGIPGWLSTVMLTTFIGGLMLINLGIVGLYVGRIYDQTKGRPLYVVDRVVMHAGRGQAAPGEPGARD